MKAINIIEMLDAQKPSIKMHKPTITVTCQVVSSTNGNPMPSAKVELVIDSAPSQVLVADAHGRVKFTMTRELWEHQAKLLLPSDCIVQLHLPEIFTVTLIRNGRDDPVSPIDLQQQGLLEAREVKVYYAPATQTSSQRCFRWLLQVRDEIEKALGIRPVPFGIIILAKARGNVSIMAELPLVPIDAESLRNFPNTKWAWSLIHEWAEVSLAPQLFYIGGGEQPMESAHLLRFVSDGLAEFITYRIALHYARGAIQHRLEKYLTWADELLQKGITQYEMAWFQSVVEGKEIVSPLEDKYGYPMSFLFWWG